MHEPGHDFVQGRFHCCTRPVMYHGPCVFGVEDHTLRVSASSYGCPLNDLGPPPMSTELATVSRFVLLRLAQASKQVGHTQGSGQTNSLALNERWSAFGHRTPRNGAKISEYWTCTGLLGDIRVWRASKVTSLMALISLWHRMELCGSCVHK